jgi:hypothetical protein
MVINKHYVGDGDIVYRQACKLGCEGIASKRLGSTYRSGRSQYWLRSRIRRHQRCGGKRKRIGAAEGWVNDCCGRAGTAIVRGGIAFYRQ